VSTGFLEGGCNPVDCLPADARVVSTGFSESGCNPEQNGTTKENNVSQNIQILFAAKQNGG